MTDRDGVDRIAVRDLPDDVVEVADATANDPDFYRCRLERHGDRTCAWGLAGCQQTLGQDFFDLALVPACEGDRVCCQIRIAG
jgi:hypothetical protein